MIEAALIACAAFFAAGLVGGLIAAALWCAHRNERLPVPPNRDWPDEQDTFPARDGGEVTTDRSYYAADPRQRVLATPGDFVIHKPIKP